MGYRGEDLDLRTPQMMAAAPFTHGAFPVTWMERRKS